MNTPDLERTTGDRRLIDRLVDGELSGAERCELLLRLDREPDGWRRCALAFLEAQSWREALGPARPVRRSGRTTTVLRMALAAGISSVLFALGWAIGTSSHHRVSVPQERLIAKAVPPKRQVLPIAPESEAVPEVRQVGFLQLSSAADKRGTPVGVPIFAGPGLDERWLREQAPALPETVRRRWEEQGYRVQQRRQLVSVEVGQGQYLAIPVDDVNLEYDSSRPL